MFYVWGCSCWLIACCRLVLGCLFALFGIGGVCVCFAACCFAGFACVRCFAMDWFRLFNSVVDCLYVLGICCWFGALQLLVILCF